MTVRQVMTYFEASLERSLCPAADKYKTQAIDQRLQGVQGLKQFNLHSILCYTSFLRDRNLVYTFWRLTRPKKFRGYEWYYLIAECGFMGTEKVWCISMLLPVIKQQHKTQTRDWTLCLFFIRYSHFGVPYGLHLEGITRKATPL